MTQLSTSLKKHNNAFMWLLLAVIGYSMLTPASLWVENPSEISVKDTKFGEPIEIDYKGRIKWDFMGSYTVNVRDNKTQEIFCEASGGTFPYRVGTKRPDPITLSWWAVSDTRCRGGMIPIGIYSMTTCWNIYPLIRERTFPIPIRHCAITKEPFEIF